MVHLAEVDARRLYAGEACPSMFAWCTSVLGMSEAMAFKRIRVARLVREYPAVLEYVAAGRLHLAGLVVLGPHLTRENHRERLELAAGRTRRQIEKLVADLAPKADAPTRIRRLPRCAAAGAGPAAHTTIPGSSATPGVPSGGNLADDSAAALPGDTSGEAGHDDGSATGPGNSSAEAGPGDSSATLPGDTSGQAGPGDSAATPPGDASATSGQVGVPPLRGAAAGRGRERVEPLGARRYKVQFTASEAWVDRLREAQALASHRIPDGDVAQVLDLALAALCEKLMKERYAVGAKAREAEASGAGAASRGGSTGRSRHIPSEVRRQVLARDGARCAYVAADGRRCEARRFLELHHRLAWAKGGRHTADNIELRCRTHNQHAAREDFGADQIQLRIAEASRPDRGL